MLKLSCDECNGRLYDDEKVYCDECWQKEQNSMSRYLDTISELESIIENLKYEIKQLEERYR